MKNNAIENPANDLWKLWKKNSNRRKLFDYVTGKHKNICSTKNYMQVELWWRHRRERERWVEGSLKNDSSGKIGERLVMKAKVAWVVVFLKRRRIVLMRLVLLAMTLKMMLPFMMIIIVRIALMIIVIRITVDGDGVILGSVDSRSNSATVVDKIRGDGLAFTVSE